MVLERPNVYAGRRGQILKGFSNVYQNHPLNPHTHTQDAPNRRGTTRKPILNTIFDPQINQLAARRLFSVQGSGV
jgi:hypothetical protein